MADMTFTAGLNTSEFEKNWAKLEAIGRKASEQGLPGGVVGGGGGGGGMTPGRDGMPGGGAGSLERQLGEAVKLTVALATASRTARELYHIGVRGAEEYAKRNSDAARQIDRVRKATEEAYAGAGRTLYSSGIMKFAEMLPRIASQAYEGVVGVTAAMIQILTGSKENVADYDRALKAEEERQRAAKLTLTFLEEESRLRSELAGLKEDDVTRAELEAGAKYRATLQAITAMGVSEQEANTLRANAAAVRDLTVKRAADRAEQDASTKAKEASAASMEQYTSALMLEMRLLDDIANVKADSVERAGISARDEYQQELLAIEKLNVTNQQAEQLQALAAARRDARTAKAREDAQKLRESEVAGVRALGDRALLEQLSANGVDSEATALRAVLDLEQQIARVREAKLSAAEESALIAQLEASAMAQVNAAAMRDNLSAAGRLNSMERMAAKFSITAGNLGSVSTRQALGLGPVNSISRTDPNQLLKQVVDKLEAIRRNTGGDSVAVFSN